MEDESQRWLGLREASELLGVHPSTLRSWADQGKVPVSRTPGGHRRFLRADLMSLTQRTAKVGSDEMQLLIQNALGRTRLELSEGRLEGEDWYRRLDEEQRLAYRKESRRLLQLLSLVASQGEEGSMRQALELGRDYAQLAHSAGLSLAEAVEAFLFFREFLVESIFSLSGTTSVGIGSTWAALRRMISTITNQVLLELIRTLEHPDTPSSA